MLKLSSNVNECKPLITGEAPDQTALVVTLIGRVVQADPIKPTLKAPETNRSMMKYDQLVSYFAFNSKLRRYT